MCSLDFYLGAGEHKHAEEEQLRPWGGVPCTSSLDRILRRTRRSGGLSRPSLEGLEDTQMILKNLEYLELT